MAFACNKFCKPQKCVCVNFELSNLKVVSCHERKLGNGSLLGTPTLTEEGVSYEGFLLQAGVEVKSNVTAVGIA